MMPVNTKSMFSILCKTIEKVENEDINLANANTMAKLIGQANNLLNYELKRAALMTNPEFRNEHRNLESKNFDSLE